MRTVPLRRISRMSYGDALPAEARVDGDVPVMSSSGVTGQHDEANTAAPCIVIGRKGSHGSVHWSEQAAFVIDTAYWIDHRSTEHDLRWLYYLLSSLDLAAASQDVGVPGLAREAAYALRVPGPPPVEQQRRIADFLDDQVVRLDRAVALGRRQMELLEEAAVTEMTAVLTAQESERVPIKWLGAHVTTGPFGTALAASEYVDRGVPIVNPSHILDGRLRPSQHETVSAVVAARLARHRLREGNLVVSRKGDIGRSALVPREADGWVCGSDSIAIDLTNAKIRPRYLQALLRLPVAREQLLRRSVGATMPSLNEDNLLGLRVPLLNESEQAAREQNASAIDEQTQRARQLIAAREHLVSERKQALITAAVTGQFDVTTARTVA
jgi:type I restriction enzyme S subunit